MEILPITIAAPRADKFGAQADEAKDGWFAKLLQASDERPDFRDPPAVDTREPNRTAANDRPGDEHAAATAPANDEAVEAPGDLPAQPEGPADRAPVTAPVESPPEQRAASAARPAAKLPPTATAPGARTGAGPEAQLTAASPAEKTTHSGPQPMATPAATKAGAPPAPSPASGHNPNPVPEPGAMAPVVAPLSQARVKTPIDSRSMGPNAEPLAKPSGAREDSARKEPALAKTTAASIKASAEGGAPSKVQNTQHGLGAQAGLTAASPGPGTNRAPAQQPGSTAAPLGAGQNATNGISAAADARPAALPSAPPGGATEQVALRIHKAVAGGQERISIKLHPAELGRIEVKLAWSDDGLMRAMISADKGETLELLQRDSRALERTLQDAGVKTDQGSLSFDLRGQGGRGEASDDPGPQTGDSNAAEGDEAEPSDGAFPAAANHGLHRGLLDLSV